MEFRQAGSVSLDSSGDRRDPFAMKFRVPYRQGALLGLTFGQCAAAGGLAPKSPPSLFRFPDADELPFFSNIVLELREDSDKLEKHSSHSGAGIDSLLVGEDIDLEVL